MLYKCRLACVCGADDCTNGCRACCGRYHFRIMTCVCVCVYDRTYLTHLIFKNAQTTVHTHAYHRAIPVLHSSASVYICLQISAQEPGVCAVYIYMLYKLYYKRHVYMPNIITCTAQVTRGRFCVCACVCCIVRFIILCVERYACVHYAMPKRWPEHAPRRLCPPNSLAQHTRTSRIGTPKKSKFLLILFSFSGHV